MEHDPECPCDGWEIVEGSPAPNQCACYLIRRIEARTRADERERCGREAQQAVAAMPLRSFPDGGVQAALIWRDGWQTGHDAARGEA